MAVVVVMMMMTMMMMMMMMGTFAVSAASSEGGGGKELGKAFEAACASEATRKRTRLEKNSEKRWRDDNEGTFTFALERAGTCGSRTILRKR